MPFSFTIRPAGPADAEAVSAVLTAAYGTLTTGHYDASLIAAALPYMGKANPQLLQSGTYHVAEGPAGRIVACGGWSFAAPGSGERHAGLAHLRHFGTDPGWTGQGIARALYQLCEAEARAAGAQRLACQASLNAEGFYWALGFRRVGPVAIALGPDIKFPGIALEREI
jgi:predicted N-acetyltransferase YhbS